ncbi:type I methionyl aminopeptidase [Candidatus Cytomitobacter indipagum]|uniref:Methionine aminopeptidase n=1 Tax=Candidatus Cytomitobacter indipagum TaxID=2601575 RepID=A0A5C0UDG9_9PROT|nr:type I methionyl aminopeptidase [Candidatus Cytomitobacter indipagum]QEK37799.1 type I methionyl aminopeptidase [Candidatus Cytomitobacter indipagum]
MVRKNKFGVKIYDESSFEKMSKACKLASKTIDYLKQFVKAGITTKYIDKMCEEFILKNGGKPTCKGYSGFPASLCTSINDVACHGIPNDIELKDGDIINLDVVVEIDGWHGDTSKTFAVGKISEQHQNLLRIAEEAMNVGIESVKIGGCFNDIGRSIEQYVKKQKGFCLIPKFCGHGIGQNMHEDPLVLHFETYEETSTIEKGMFFTIEPIISCGSSNVREMKDGWTMVTKDNGFAAQFEHTISIGHDEKIHILT